MMKQLAGSLHTGAKQAQKADRVPLLFGRFLFPSFKNYEIITEYTMAETDVLSNGHVVQQNVANIIEAIIIAFWNGNGIYVPKNLDFYHLKVLQLIKLCNRYYRQYFEYFRGSKVCPLFGYQVQVDLREQILVNKFSH